MHTWESACKVIFTGYSPVYEGRAAVTAPGGLPKVCCSQALQAEPRTASADVTSSSSLGFVPAFRRWIPKLITGGKQRGLTAFQGGGEQGRAG